MSSTQDCTSVTLECPVEATIYGYYPSLGANAFFAAFFGVFLIIQTFQGFKSRIWSFTIAVSLGCLTECIGYIGRCIMHSNPWSNAGFQMQICCLILAPAFLSAGIYLTLRNMVLTFGTEFSFLRPNLYTWIFISVDILSLCCQAAGGATAATSNTQDQADIGSDVMLAGIVLQVASLIAFAILTITFFLRVHRNRQALTRSALTILTSKAFYLFALGVIVAFITILIRCLYRIPEMSNGWQSSIMQNETDFIVLDGVMISIATLAMTVTHPGFCCPQLWTHARKVRVISKTIAPVDSMNDTEKGMDVEQ